MFPHLYQFGDIVHVKLADKYSYKANIGRISLRLSKLQESDKEAQKIRTEGLNGYKNTDMMLHYWKLPFIPEIIGIEIIIRHHDDPLADHFSINKLKKLINQKYYWSSLGKIMKLISRAVTFA